MKFSNLLEELKDIPIHNVLYHGTNANFFYDILKDGYLQGSFFYTKSLEDDDNNYSKIKELATTRKSTIIKMKALEKNKNELDKFKKNLSNNIGAVLFYLYKDRIIGNKYVRNVTVKPIAEIPKSNINSMKELFSEFGIKYSNKLSYFLLKKFNYYKEKGIKVNSSRMKKHLYEILEDFFGVDGFDENIDLDYLIHTLNMISNYALNKENEERIVLKKNSHIKLLPDIMKIELFDGIIDETKKYIMSRLADETGFSNYENSNFSKFIEERKKQIKEDLLQLVLKYNNIIEQNKNYKDLILYLEG